MMIRRPKASLNVPQMSIKTVDARRYEVPAQKASVEEPPSSADMV